MANQGVMRFPGVSRIIEGTFTLSHGITPSVALLRIVPQDRLIAETGPLTIEYGQTRIRIDGCRVRGASIQRETSSGRIVSLQIEDRRWKWRYGEISGRYNIRFANGQIDTINSDEKTPQQLATLLLKAMREQRYDVSQLPNDTRPESDWVGVNPAQELANLCESLGCRIVLGTDNVVRIVKLGTGRALPNIGAQTSEGYGFETQGRPDSVKFIGGPTVYQAKFELEAVGLDKDGRWKPIDNLSYYPRQSSADPPPEAKGFRWTTWPINRLDISSKAERDLAVETVFRCYRIVNLANGSLQIPGCSVSVSELHQLLPIRTALVNKRLSRRRDENDRLILEDQQAYVEGIWYSLNPRLQNFPDTSTDLDGRKYRGRRYPDSFSIDAEFGIVKFSDYVYKLSDTDHQPAELYLTCAFTVRDSETHMEDRYQLEKQLTGRPQGTGAFPVRDDSLFRTVVAIYGNDPRQSSQVDTNETALDRDVNQVVRGALSNLQRPQSNDIEYAGIVDINPDGAIQQVSWRVSTTGAKTRAGRNTEFNLAVPSYQERRRQEFAAALAGRIKVDPDTSQAPTKRRRVK